MKIKKVIVVGGGAAGMMAAGMIAEKGIKTELYEKNEKLGKKLFITGKGRCNLTNSSSMDTVMENIMSNRKFMYSALNGFSNEAAIDYFRSLGLQLKVERGNRVFPVSDHSSDVIAALTKKMNSNQVSIHMNTAVKDIITDEDGRCTGIRLDDRTVRNADAVIIATGGLSYPSTGSTGDGYRFAETAGMKVTDRSPSLVPMNIKGELCRELQGLSLKNISVRVTRADGRKELFSDFGEMLFTHFGVSGPVILSASGAVAYHEYQSSPVLHIDLKPALAEEQLDKRILRDFAKNENREFKNSLSELFPAKLIPVMVRLSGIDPSKQVNSITREERAALVRLIKDFAMTVSGLRGFEEAVITKGGVSVKDIDPHTMESKKAPGLYFAGEVIDVDALTGGYNLQAAWSTAAAAAAAVTSRED